VGGLHYCLTQSTLSQRQTPHAVWQCREEPAEEHQRETLAHVQCSAYKSKNDLGIACAVHEARRSTKDSIGCFNPEEERPVDPSRRPPSPARWDAVRHGPTGAPPDKLHVMLRHMVLRCSPWAPPWAGVLTAGLESEVRRGGSPERRWISDPA